MYCNDCGAGNTGDANYCKQCGRKLDKSNAPKASEDDFAVSPDDRVEDLLVIALKKNEQGEIDTAMATCHEALAIKPDSTDIHSLMSTLYEKRGQIPEAIYEREKVLALNPGSIADREKLEQLRDATSRITPRKIISSRRKVASRMMDNPAGAATLALAVTLFILMIGGIIVWARTNKLAKADNNPSFAATVPNTAFPYQGANNLQNGLPAPRTNITPYPSTGETAATQSPVAVPQNNYPMTAGIGNPPLPAPLSARSVGILERDTQRTLKPRTSVIPDISTTEHLPDSTFVRTPASADTASPPQQTTSPGHIEITVLPDNSSHNPTNVNNANMDSNNQKHLAQRYQMEGKYRLAATSYIKALDGAGDDAASIQQQIGYCYQKLDDKDAAISHYNEAINAYKNQISAGRNTNSANQGIKVCQAGINACR